MRSLLFLFSLLFVTSIAFADDFPTRKSGLWEIEMEMGLGMPAQKMTQCIDAATDSELLTQSQASAGKHCSKNVMQKKGSKYVHESDCKFGETRMITSMVFSGDFNRSYRADSTTKYSPPVAGRSEMKMTMKGRYLGECKGGQKPGEVYMSDGTRVDLSTG